MRRLLGATGASSLCARFPLRMLSSLPTLRDRAKMRQMMAMRRGAPGAPAGPVEPPPEHDMSMRNVLRALAGNSFITGGMREEDGQCDVASGYECHVYPMLFTTSSGSRCPTFFFESHLGPVVAKFGSFSVSGSSAMLSEAIHTLVDTGNQVLLYVGLKASRRTADKAHPYGYGRAAFFYSLVSAMGIFWVGCGAAVYHGVTHIAHLPDVPIEYGLLTWATLGVSFLIDGTVLMGALRDIKKEAGSTPFWKHFRRIKDPFILTVVLEDFAATTGIGIAIAGILASQQTGNPLWDGVASIAVGGLLGGVAISLIGMNKEFLLGKAVDPFLEQQVTDIICKRASVDQVYRVKSRWEGPSTFAYKSELDFEGAYFAKLLREMYKDKFTELYELRDIDERDRKLQDLLQVYAEDLTRCIEREIFAIQQEVRKQVPSAEWVELQPLSKTVQPYALGENYRSYLDTPPSSTTSNKT